MRALSLFSGGLDSVLSIKAIENQGIEVIALHIQTGFITRGDIVEQLQKSLEFTNAKLEIIDIRDEYIRDTLFSPKYGYGKNFNPCIDCHGKMVNVAFSLLEKYDASFIISGEVLGQRPMSQNQSALNSVKNISNSQDLLVRPLSAKLLPDSLPEIKGWIDTNKMYDINGRGREAQIALAKEFGIEEYQSPGGGCLLTDIMFSKRMFDFIKYDKDFCTNDIDIIKYGRHFRLPDGNKLVIARDEREGNIFLDIKSDRFTVTDITDKIGPVSLLQKDISENDKKLAFKIIFTYYKKDDKEAKIIYDREYIISDRFENKEETHKYLVK
jgi:tRNA-specific 2-thiouridylase